jgi:hypothetical protein
VEKLARYVDKEKKIGVKLIVSAHLLKRISHVASTGSSPGSATGDPVLVQQQGRERWHFLNVVPLRHSYERWPSGSQVLLASLPWIVFGG